MVGGEHRLEIGLVEREERRRDHALQPAGRGVAAAAILVAGGGLKLREALEPERLREAHDGRARSVRAARQLFGCRERGLVQMVDDVLAHVLLRAREFLEALADLVREGDCGIDGAGHGRMFRSK